MKTAMMMFGRLQDKRQEKEVFKAVPLLDRPEKIVYNNFSLKRRWQYDSQMQHHAESEVVLPVPSVNIAL